MLFPSFSASGGPGVTAVEVVVWFGGKVFTGAGRSSTLGFRGGTGCKWGGSGLVAFGVVSVAGVVKNRYEWNDTGS